MRASKAVPSCHLPAQLLIAAAPSSTGVGGSLLGLASRGFLWRIISHLSVRFINAQALPGPSVFGRCFRHFCADSPAPWLRKVF